MSIWRRAARQDTAQGPIVAALRAVGARVWIIGQPFDLLVGFRGRLVMLEVKSIERARKDQAEQTAELEACKRDGLPVYRVMRPLEALGAIGAVCVRPTGSDVASS